MSGEIIYGNCLDETCFAIVLEALNFEEAEAKCARDFGGRLAETKTEAGHDFVQRIIDGKKDVFRRGGWE